MNTTEGQFVADVAPASTTGGPSLVRLAPIRALLASIGPGYLVAVGYMDPGNWVTDIAAGSRFSYDLLSVVLIANLMAMVLQSLSVRLGIATGRDLARLCRDIYPRPVSFLLWIACQIAIIACDLAEVIGTAIALELLFSIPVTIGICLTIVGTLLVLWLQRMGRRPVEVVIIALILIVACCLWAELWFAKPSLSGIVAGLIPHAGLVHDNAKLYLAIGIIGATVMPHNLYLHGALVRNRGRELFAVSNAQTTFASCKNQALRYATVDCCVALCFAFLVNAAILILAAATFHTQGYQQVGDLRDAYHLLAPLLGTSVASVLFGIALLAAGQNSTVTATMAGQIVMEGFLDLRLSPWMIRLVTRCAALIPALVVVNVSGAQALTHLLVLSQVVLSLQLPFAVGPLIHFSVQKQLMGSLVCPRWLSAIAVFMAVVLMCLNLKLLADVML